MPAAQGANKVTISNQIFGGVADTMYLGLKDSVHKMVCCDIHSEPGVLKVNQATKKISGSLVDGFIKQSVACSNGETYMFDSLTGKIWRVASDGVTMSLCYTTSPSTGEAKCTGAHEYNGYVIWATELWVHQIPIANAKSESSWSTVTLNYKAFLNGDKVYHPMEEQNDVLYVGDGFVLAQLEGTTWSQNALNLPYPLQHRISALCKYLTNLISGTFVNSNVVQSIITVWNTWSVSFSFKDELPEAGVNSFLKTQNMVLANIGMKGNFYLFSGVGFGNNSQMDQFKRMPGNWGGPLGPNQAKAHVDAQVNVNGLPMFGMSNVYGNPIDLGVWSIGSYSREYPQVINLEYIISTGHTTNIEIGSIIMNGTNMYIAWVDRTVVLTPVYGVDTIDMANKAATAYFDTRIIESDRTNLKEFSVSICYRSLPSNTNITLQANINNAGFGSALTLLPDVSKNQFNTKVKIKAATVQFRVTAVASVNTAPEIESTEITFN